ncbi:MAG: hypothetical protein P8O97_02895 [Gammaproteobacteria bacterium]|jgi:hypothetical protein|nr:hypothetical protein [Gammaproteobacteria bacterium]|tara:strand:+ start:24479 stop:24865 length:387 start_codon:yes stop_codon:yes gene_type:complete
MAEKNITEMTLEERVKTLERLQRNARIAIIILVGYFIYDVISRDSGSDIIYAYKIKAKQFELVDGVGTIFASWKVLDEENSEAAIVLENGAGQKLRLTASEISLLSGGSNPSPDVVIDRQGIDTQVAP